MTGTQEIKYTSNNMMLTILQKFPEYKPSWQNHLKNWKNNTDRTLGIDSINFAEFVIDTAKVRLSEKFLTQLFDLIEDFLEFGDEDVIYAATSFLQDITNTFSHYIEQIPFETYIPLLGPRSKAFCRYLDGFYGTKTPGL